MRTGTWVGARPGCRGVIWLYVSLGDGAEARSHGCIRREGTAEAASEAVRQADGGGYQSGWRRLLSVTIERWHLPSGRQWLVMGWAPGGDWGGGTGHLGLTHTETQRGRLRTACGQRRVDSKNSQTTPATTSTSSICQLLGAADAQTAHPATSSTAPAHQRRAPRTRKRHQREHRPQRSTERSDPTQHAKGRRGDCPGPRKETTTRRTATQGEGSLPSNASLAAARNLAMDARTDVTWRP